MDGWGCHGCLVWYGYVTGTSDDLDIKYNLSQIGFDCNEMKDWIIVILSANKISSTKA